MQHCKSNLKYWHFNYTIVVYLEKNALNLYIKELLIKNISKNFWLLRNNSQDDKYQKECTNVLQEL